MESFENGIQMPEKKMGKVEAVVVSEITLGGDLGGTHLNLGWESIKGDSNMNNSSLREMLEQVFELMGIEKERAIDFIKHEDGDPDLSPYGEEKIDISLEELSELTGKDYVDTRDLLGKASKYFLDLSKEE